MRTSNAQRPTSNAERNDSAEFECSARPRGVLALDADRAGQLAAMMRNLYSGTHGEVWTRLAERIANEIERAGDADGLLLTFAGRSKRRSRGNFEQR